MSDRTFVEQRVKTFERLVGNGFGAKSLVTQLCIFTLCIFDVEHRHCVIMFTEGAFYVPVAAF